MKRDVTLPEDVKAQFNKIAELIAYSKAKITAFVVGGTAVHLYDQDRAPTDLDITWSRAITLPDHLSTFEMTLETGDKVLVSLDGSFFAALGSFHPDWKDDAETLHEVGNISVKIVSALDLAVSKIARFQDHDRRDIERLARTGNFTSEEFSQRGEEALDYFIGDLTLVSYNLRDAIEIVKGVEDEYRIR